MSSFCLLYKISLNMEGRKRVAEATIRTVQFMLVPPEVSHQIGHFVCRCAVCSVDVNVIAYELLQIIH